MKRLITLLFILFLFFIPTTLFAQFTLGFEMGGSAPVTYAKNFKGAFFISPKLELPYVSFAYNYHPDLGGNSADLHSLDVCGRIDIGESFVKPYFSAGLGYGFFHIPGNFMHGLHIPVTFGVNVIPEKVAKKIGVPVIFGAIVRYNAELFDAESAGNIPGRSGFTAFQFLSFGTNLSFLF